MQILNFFKSLISPVKMYKYRYMTVLLSICIFILSSYLLAIPRATYMKNHGLDLVVDNNYGDIQAIYNIPDTEEVNAVITKISDLECSASDGTFKCNNLKDSKGEELNYYEDNIVYVRSSDNVTINIKIVFDLYDKSKEEVAKYNITENFTYISDNYPIVIDDRFPNIENNEYYLILLNSEYLFYQAHPYNINTLKFESKDNKYISKQSTSYYSGLNIDDETFSQSGSITGQNLAKQITNSFVILENNTYSFITLIICLIYPIVLSLLFWLFFRNKGRLKKYREYFNIAGISIIIPVLLSFIAAWIAPLSDIMFNIYLLGFSLYYLYVLYKINNTSTIM